MMGIESMQIQKKKETTDLSSWKRVTGKEDIYTDPGRLSQHLQVPYWQTVDMNLKA